MELHKKISKKLSYLLRHDPDSCQLSMNKNGYVLISELVDKAKIPYDTIIEIVDTDNKNRYQINDGKIRARQGHSIPWVDLELEFSCPPDVLYHGTSKTNKEKIYESGSILSMSRTLVHLTDNIETAIDVGQRHSKNGEVSILVVDSKQMFEDGFNFYLSTNNVWLTDSIPISYLTVIECKKEKGS